MLATLAPVSVRAGSPQPIPGSGSVIELEHAVELSTAPEGATLHVTRTLFNAASSPAQVELPIPLSCDATLDRVAIEEQDAQGQLRMRAADVLDANDAAQRWDAWLEGPGDDVQTALDADSALLLTRDNYDCGAQLSIYPIPPLLSRKVSYRVFIPSEYVDGRYEIELPSFDAYGEIAKLKVAGDPDDALWVHVDGKKLGKADIALLGDQAHEISLERHDAGVGQVRAVDLDLATMIAKHSAATARLEPDELTGRLLTAEFEAPRELASLPPVRRVVVLLDSSRSLESGHRSELQQIAARYLELLAQDPSVQAEVVLFDRELRPLYHDLVPAKWAAEDLRDLEFDVANGSDLDTALAAARKLLAEPTEREGADWILVLSDLYLRSGFSLAAELDTAASSLTRMHVVRPILDDDDRTARFHPGGSDEAWTMIARETGGMLWYADDGRFDMLAQELIRPMHIWSLRLELALADGSRRDMLLADMHDAGESSEWLDAAHQGAALERAAFVGEVWGQRRAWTAAPTDEEAQRTAGRLATAEDQHLSDAARTALAAHAQVISPFTSAWALASFGGPAEAPAFGCGTLGLGGRSYSTTCGGAYGNSYGGLFSSQTLEQLTRDAIASCPNAKPGRLTLEITNIEIVSVLADDVCVREQSWAIDLTGTDLTGRRVAQVEYGGGNPLGDFAEVEMGYLDLTMPTPNITTKTARGMK